jgi:hypothetical protein
MKKRVRRVSRAEVTEIWRRWKQHETLAVIGRALACSLYTVHSVIRRTGGIAPAPRRRAPWARGGARGDFARDCRPSFGAGNGA